LTAMRQRQSPPELDHRRGMIELKQRRGMPRLYSLFRSGNTIAEPQT
jgi:hypothetical protein